MKKLIFTAISKLSIHKRFRLLVPLSVMLGLVGSAWGQSPGQRDFDVVSLSGFDQLDQSASGTSNGVGWKICDTFFSSCCGANINGTFDGFNTFNFAPPVAGEDVLHVGGQDLTIIFDQPVGSIVFYLREDGGIASFDFILTPIVISGGGNLNIVGTRIFPNTSGGAVRFDNVNSRTITGVHGALDGMNLAFYVESVTPGPTIPAVCPGDDCADFPCGEKGNKVQVCHVPPGNSANQHTICISPNAVSAHLAHGDFCGPCTGFSNKMGTTNDTPPDEYEVEKSSLMPITTSYGSEWKIYPNPSDGKFTLSVPIDKLVSVYVIDILGQVVDQKLNVKSRALNIDISNKPSGVYFVKVVTGNEMIIRKILHQ